MLYLILGLKKKYIVDNVVLGFINKGSEIIPMHNELNSKNAFEIITQLGVEQLNNNIFVHLFKLSDGLTRKTYFYYTDIHLVRRNSYFPDLEQLNYICSDLCIFGKGSPKCLKCEIKKIQNDI